MAIVQYEHHGDMVWVDEQFKGKHRENCLCYKCGNFHPGEEGNCPIAKKLLALCIEFSLVTPVYECAVWEAKN